MARNGGNGMSALQAAVQEEAARIVGPLIAGVEQSILKLRERIGVSGSTAPVTAPGNGTRKRRVRANGDAPPAAFTPTPGEIVTYKVGRGTFQGTVKSVDLEERTAEIEREGGKPSTRTFSSLSPAA